jgi:3,4-dihydroxy-2-butanone 4-phosphate synthase
MARRDDCWAFARRWGLKVISIADLADYVEKDTEARVPLPMDNA